MRPLAHPQQPYEAGSYPFREWKRKHWALLQGFLCVTSSLQGWPSLHGWEKPFIFPASGSGAFQRCEVPSPANADSTEPAPPGPQPPKLQPLHVLGELPQAHLASPVLKGCRVTGQKPDSVFIHQTHTVLRASSPPKASATSRGWRVHCHLPCSAYLAYLPQEV